MRFVRLTVCLSGVFFLSMLAAADEQNVDGSDAVIRSLAESYQDERSLEQIKKDNALIRAAAGGEVEQVRQLIKDGALVNSRYMDGFAFLDVGRTGYTALMFASRAGHDDVVKLLIENKADLELERRGKTSLYFAVTRGRESVVKLLVKAGAKGDVKELQLTYDLLRAACRGFKMQRGEGYPLFPGYIGEPEKAPEIVEVLKRGADVNAADSGGYTALMYAANLGCVDNVKVLLANGADAIRESKDGETALSLAERSGSSVARAGRGQVAEILKAHLAKQENRQK